METVSRGPTLALDERQTGPRTCLRVPNVVSLRTGGYDVAKETATDATSNPGVTSVVAVGTAESRIKTPGIGFLGTPTSTEQRDCPNAWPPLQAFVIRRLDRTEHEHAQRAAGRNCGETGVRSRANYRGFADDVRMSIPDVRFDNHRRRRLFSTPDACARFVSSRQCNVENEGETGSGGEYAPQTGFGWTNGVVFELLNRWNDDSAMYTAARLLWRTINDNTNRSHTINK